MRWLGTQLNVAFEIVGYFRLYFLDSFDLDFFVGFRLGFDTGIGVASAAGSVAACTGFSIGMYVLVLVVGVGSESKSQSPAMKIIEPGIAKTG